MKLFFCKLKAIINVKCNWEPNIDYIEAHKKGIYVLSAAPAMAPAVAEACVGYAINLSRGTIQNYNKFLKSEEITLSCLLPSVKCGQ